MKKVISILLSIFIITTVVSSIAFASTTETGLIAGYSGTPTVANLSTACNTNEVPGGYEYTMKSANKNVSPIIYFDTNFIGNTLTNDAKFIKASFTVTPSVAYKMITAEVRPAESTKTQSKIIDSYAAGTDYEITFLLDRSNNDLYVYIDGMLVASRLGGTYEISSSTKLGFKLTFQANSKIAASASAFKITNLTQTAYDSTATLETLNLYTNKATYTEGTGYALSPSMTVDVNNASVLVNHGLTLYGSAEDPFVVYVAGYTDDTLLFVKEWNHNRSDTITIPTEEEADELKVFVWDAETLKPYMLAAPVKTSN